jgi:hypothetical protein
VKVFLSAIVALLALAVGILHFALDFVLFRGNIFGRLGPAPGAPRPSGAPSGPPAGAPRPPSFPFGLQLPQVFLANLILFVVLVIAFLLVLRGRPSLASIVDLLLVLAALATLYGWNSFNRPNPQGLGIWAVGLEIALIVFALAHAVVMGRGRQRMTAMSSSTA